MLSWLKSIVAPSRLSRTPVGGRRVRVVRARYDAASTNPDNYRHWANADGLSANAANSPQVRRTLRNRARYEVANNSYARGIVLTLANDCVGTGPRLQMLTPNPEANRRAEAAFEDWAGAVGLMANCHRDPAKTRPFTPADFNPYGTEDKRRPIPKTKDLSVLKAVFVDSRQGGRTHG
jgi:hypothetical protein